MSNLRERRIMLSIASFGAGFFLAATLFAFSVGSVGWAIFAFLSFWLFIGLMCWWWIEYVFDGLGSGE